MPQRLILLASGLCVLLSASLAAAERITVVELFTSQGCSSCPPADALLSEFAGASDLLPLSEHVDYWDYLGWADPFASPENTRRQRSYARQLGLSYVYTPQVVVDGMKQAAGSDRSLVLRLIAEVQAQPSLPIDVVHTAEGRLAARLGKATLPSAVEIWLVRFEPVHRTMVERGENRGRHIENRNVVRGFTRLAEWDGEPVSLALPTLSLTPGMAYAVLVQQSGGGRILGAAKLQAATDGLSHK